MESKRSALTCRHCGLEDPALKAYEPCRRCGRIYEPSPDEEPSSPAAIYETLTGRWGLDPPYTVIVVLGATFFGLAYGQQGSGRIRYWVLLFWGSVCVVWLIAKWTYHLIASRSRR